MDHVLVIQFNQSYFMQLLFSRKCDRAATSSINESDITILYESDVTCRNA